MVAVQHGPLHVQREPLGPSEWPAASDIWRREIAAGTRTPETDDWMRRAHFLEQLARSEAAMGLHPDARQTLQLVWELAEEHGGIDQIFPSGHGTTSEAPRAFLTDAEVEELPPVQFLVDGIIPIGAAAEIHGPPGSGKSFVALAVGCAVGTGRGFCGHAVRRGAVIYVVGEGLAGIGARLRAWKDEYGVTGSVGLFFKNGPVQLLDATDVVRFIEAVKALPMSPVLIVLDTLARCMVGGDENSAKDMGLAIAAIDRIRAATGAAVLVVHHTRKDGESERGSTALRGALDAMLLVQNDGAGRITISCEKQKDAAAFSPVVLKLKPVGDSCALVAITDASEFEAEAIKPQHYQALRSLSRDFLEDGATATQWLKASLVKEASFYRALTELVRWGYVQRPAVQRGGRYTLTDKGRELIAINYHEAINSLSGPPRLSLSASRPPLGGGSDDSEAQLTAWGAA